MRITQVQIRGLRALQRSDLSFQRGTHTWTSVCVRGLNGSGKTTLLEGIAQLWQWFRRCAKQRGWAEPTGTPLLAEAELFAMELTDLPGPVPRMWVTWGQRAVVEQFRRDLTDGTVATSDPAVLSWWDEAFTRSEMGGERLPNFVWIQAENKWVPELRKSELLREFQGPVSPAVARYIPEARGPSHLEGLLGTLKLVDEKRYEQLRRWIAELFPNLSLHGFDEASRRPLFRVAPTGHFVTVDKLSAGERSVMINLTMVLRWLGPGGIVLLDEPELHQHSSLMRGNIAVLEAVVQDGGGQLIAASHADEVWQHFRARERIVDLSWP